MGRQLDRIPVPEKLDEVIGESLRQLRREKRKKRMTAAAGLAAAVSVCMAGYVLGRNAVQYGEEEQQTAAGNIEARTDEPEYLFARGAEEDEIPAEHTDSVYLQESEGITLTVSNVYHNGYTMYMTVLMRSEEPFSDSLSRYRAGQGYTAELESRGESGLEGENSGIPDPDIMTGRFIDDRTFAGTVCTALPDQENGEIPDQFAYEWNISSISMEEDDGSKVTCRGDWNFQVEVEKNTGRTEVTDINGTNRNGEGIGRVVKTADDIYAEILIPEEARREDYTVAVCDASGALMNEAGEYYRTENRDISTVYIFLCDREEYEKLKSGYRSGENAAGSGSRIFAEILKEHALYSTELHFRSQYLCVYQMA